MPREAGRRVAFAGRSFPHRVLDVRDRRPGIAGTGFHNQGPGAMQPPIEKVGERKVTSGAW